MGPLSLVLVLAVALALPACGKGRQGTGYDGVIELDQHSLGFEVGGRLSEVRCRRGDRVRKDQLLGRLDDTLERSQRPIRAADLDGAEARLHLLEAGARRSDIRSLEAQVQAAATQVEGAERELHRQTDLLTRGAGTRALVDDLGTRLSQARAERDAAAERLRTLQAGSRSQEVRAAAAARDGARAALGALDERLRHYELRAPSDGLLLDVVAREGEVLAPGATVALFAQPEAPYADLFVPVGALAGLHVGQAAAVRPDGDPRAYPGRIEHISTVTEYTPRYLLSEADRQNLVIRVRVRIDDREERLHAGVPCRVELLAGVKR